MGSAARSSRPSALGDRSRMEISCDDCGESWKGERRELDEAPRWVRDSTERKAPEPETAHQASARADFAEAQLTMLRELVIKYDPALAAVIGLT